MVEHKWGLFLELIRWAEGGTCRHDAILRYFGDEAETLDGCGRCDVCLALGTDAAVQDPEAVTPDRAQGAVGRGARPRPLRAPDRGAPRARRVRTSGSSGPASPPRPTFGNLREHPAEWLARLLRRCVTAGWVSFAAETARW